MAIMRPRRKRLANSISLQIGICSARAAASCGKLCGTPGLGMIKILIEECGVGVSAEFERATCFAKFCRGFGDLIFGALFARGDARAAAGAEKRGGDAGAGESHDQNALPR